MMRLVLLLLTLWTVQASAKNEQMLANLLFYVPKETLVPANADSFVIAFDSATNNYCRIFYGGAVPFDRYLKTDAVFTAQGGAEDERKFSVADFKIIVMNQWGVDLSSRPEEGIEELGEFLATQGIKYEIPKEVKTARINLVSKKTNRAMVIECVDMHLPEALIFLNKSGTIRPVTDL